MRNGAEERFNQERQEIRKEWGTMVEESQPPPIAIGDTVRYRNVTPRRRKWHTGTTLQVGETLVLVEWHGDRNLACLKDELTWNHTLQCWEF